MSEENVEIVRRGADGGNQRSRDHWGIEAFREDARYLLSRSGPTTLRPRARRPSEAHPAVDRELRRLRGSISANSATEETW